MKNKKTLILALVCALTTVACSHLSVVEQPAETTKTHGQLSQSTAVQSLLATDLETLWSQDFDHYQDGLLLQVSRAIAARAAKGDLADKELEKLSFYLRIYSSFGPDEGWSEQAAPALNNALLALQAMPGFYQITPTTARLHENYAVALYRFYFLEPLRLSTADHIESLTKLINLYANTEFGQENDNQSVQYALWEILRASAILPYEATRKNKADHLAIYANNKSLTQALLAFIDSENAVVNGDDWPKKHAAWSLAQYYNVYNTQYLNAYYEKRDAEPVSYTHLTLPTKRIV